jgi:hypothetical protein
MRVLGRGGAIELSAAAFFDPPGRIRYLSSNRNALVCAPGPVDGPSQGTEGDKGDAG